MTGRLLIAAAAASVLSLSVASASSLGTLNPIVLSAAVVEHTPCTVGSVGFVDSVGGVLDLSVLPLPVVGPVVIDDVVLTGLAGDCDGMVPVVTVVGATGLALPGTGVVLSTDAFSPLDATADQTLDVTALEGLRSVFGPLSLVTDVRIAFVPA